MEIANGEAAPMIISATFDRIVHAARGSAENWEKVLGVNVWGVINGIKAFVPRMILPLSLSYDHRVIDGANGARFTSYLAKTLADAHGLTEAVP